MERRSFLKKVSLGFIGFFLGSFNVLGRSDLRSGYLLISTTHLPYFMPREKYKEFKNRFQNSSERDSIAQKYEKEGKILSIDYQFTGTKSIWTVLYKDQASCDAHQQEIARYQDLGHFKSLGFRVTYDAKLVKKYFF